MAEKGLQFETSKYERLCKKIEQVLEITGIEKIAKGTSLTQIEKELDTFLDKIAEQDEPEDTEK